MQIIINNNPVWITKREGTDISEEELKEYLGYCPDETEYFEAMAELTGYYFCTCSPGCLPDSDFYGPYKTEEEALEKAEVFYNE